MTASPVPLGDRGHVAPGVVAPQAELSSLAGVAVAGRELRSRMGGQQRVANVRRERRRAVDDRHADTPDRLVPREADHFRYLLIVEALEQFYQIKFDFNDILEMGTVGKIREKMKKYEVFVEN